MFSEVDRSSSASATSFSIHWARGGQDAFKLSADEHLLPKPENAHHFTDVWLIHVTQVEADASTRDFSDASALKIGARLLDDYVQFPQSDMTGYYTRSAT